MIYLRRYQSTVRTMIMYILIPQFLSHLLLVLQLALSHKITSQETKKGFGLSISCVLMFNFIYQGALIGFLRIHCFSTVIEDRWKLIASITLGISLAIPTILYTAVCSHYGIDVNYGNNTYNILDIIIDSKTKPLITDIGSNKDYFDNILFDYYYCSLFWTKTGGVHRQRRYS